MNYIFENTDPCISSVLMLELISVEYEETLGLLVRLLPYDWVELVLTNVQYILSVINDYVSTDLSQHNRVSCSVRILFDHSTLERDKKRYSASALL